MQVFIFVHVFIPKPPHTFFPGDTR